MTSSPSTPLNPLHPHPHHLEVTGVLPHCGSLTLSSGCCGSKNIQTKHRHEKRSGSSMMMRVRHIACPWLFCFFPPFSSLFGWKIFGSVRSAALALMRKDVLEMRILYEGVICDRVFYFFFFLFHFVSIFVAKLLLLWAPAQFSLRSPARQCGQHDAASYFDFLLM